MEIDLCIFNAGIGDFNNYDGLTEDNMDPIFQINFFSQAYISYKMVNQTNKMIFISSLSYDKTYTKNIIQSVVSTNRTYSYHTSKFLLIVWTDYLKSISNKKIMSINPGLVRTKIWNGVFENSLKNPMAFLKKIYYMFSKTSSPKEASHKIINVLNNYDFMKSYYDPYSNHSTNSSEKISKNEYQDICYWTIKNIYFFEHKKGPIFYNKKPKENNLLFNLIIILLILFIIKNLIYSLKLVQLNNQMC